MDGSTLEGIERKIDLLRGAVSRLGTRITKLENSMSALDDLKAQVYYNRSVVESAVTLIRGLRDQLASAGSDSAALEELRKNLESDAAALANAVAANTAAASEPPAPEVPLEPVEPPFEDAVAAEPAAEPQA